MLDDGCDARRDVDAIHGDVQRSLVLHTHVLVSMHRHRGGEQEHADESALCSGRHLIARSGQLSEFL